MIISDVHNQDHLKGNFSADYDRTQKFCSIKRHFVRLKCVFIELQYYGRRFSENSARSR